MDVESGNTWLDGKADQKLLLKATGADFDRIEADLERLDLNIDAAYDEGFEAGVLSSEAGVGRAEDLPF